MATNTTAGPGTGAAPDSAPAAPSHGTVERFDGGVGSPTAGLAFNAGHSKAGPSPTFGVTMIDDKPATSIRYEKSTDTGGEPSYTVSFHMDGKQVAKLKQMDHQALMDAVGDRNAMAISGAEVPKGSLKGESLINSYGLSPEENERRITAKDDRKRADAKEQEAEAFVAGMSASHPAFREAEKAEAEPNVIEHTPDRAHDLADVDAGQLAATTAELRKADRAAYEQSNAGDAIEGERARMQDRVEGEQRQVKQLDLQDRQLLKEEKRDDKAGLTPDDDQRQSIEAEKNRRIGVMQQVNEQFRVSGARHYFKDQPNRIAFRDVGDRMKSASNDQRVARGMAMMADAKGWKSLTVSGHPDFRREVWFEASTRGMAVKGYKPTERDLEALAAHQERQMGNAVERGKDREQTPVQKAAKSAPEASKADRTPTPSPTPKAAATPTLSKHEGLVLAHGAAPYNHDKAEKLSYFVTLATPAGEKTVWGKDLERAVKASNVKEGDAIKLVRTGSEQVVVEALKRDDKGKVIGTESTEAKRNGWEVQRSNREKVVAAVATAVIASKVKDPANREVVMKAMNAQIQERSKAGTLAKPKMYDKSAPLQQATKERTGPVIERNAERTR